MLDYLHRLVFAGKERISKKSTEAEPLPKINVSLEENLNFIRELHNNSSDLVIRRFVCGYGRKGALIFVDGMSDSKIIDENILRPILLTSLNTFGEGEAADFNIVRDRVVTTHEIQETAEFSDLVEGYLRGDAALLLDGFAKGLIVGCKGWEGRNVTEPQTEAVVRGPREGFTENIRVNTALLRRKIQDPRLVFECMILGEKTNTSVQIAYLRGVANPEVLMTLRRRLSRLDIDSVLESGYIEQFIEDNPYSLFSQVGCSEKPDIVAAKLLEGRVAVFVDGTPFVLTVPMLLAESFQSSEDYYIRPFYATVIRILRYLSFFLSIFSPAIYVALTTFHQEMLPTVLLFTMAASREGIPFSAPLEAFVMVTVFEILREAGLRLPRPVGQTVSIVGALVLGEAAVSAGLIGAPMVIVVAMTAIAGFVVPYQTDVISILRYFMLILASIMGGFGIMTGVLLILCHLCKLKSFGVPYFAPFAPLRTDGLLDTFMRAPLWAMTTRPQQIAKGDIVRGRFVIPPGEQRGESLESQEGE